MPDKQFYQLITIAPDLPTMLKTANVEFKSIEVWFIDDIYLSQEKENMCKDMVFHHLHENLGMNMVIN